MAELMAKVLHKYKKPATDAAKEEQKPAAKKLSEPKHDEKPKDAPKKLA